MTPPKASFSTRTLRSRWLRVGRRTDLVFTIACWGIGGGVFVHHQAGLTIDVALGPLSLIWSAHTHERTPSQ